MTNGYVISKVINSWVINIFPGFFPSLYKYYTFMQVIEFKEFDKGITGSSQPQIGLQN